MTNGESPADTILLGGNSMSKDWLPAGETILTLEKSCGMLMEFYGLKSHGFGRGFSRRLFHKSQ
jgi:hypothetical protein